MNDRQPKSRRCLSRFEAITVLTGLVAFCTIYAITVLLLRNGADRDMLSVVHLIVSAVLVAAGVAFVMTISRCRAELAELQAHASTDKLTELYNRSYLEPFLEKQIEKADKTKQPVSIIMVDLDHFKEINDNSGHAAGDHVLTIFAQVVLKCIRKTDIIARYGGDEFIVVLPDTDTETARSIAERIRRDVAEAYIPAADGINISSISCSVGLSTYPIHCASKRDLIRTSDLALYEAKRSGRNRTIVYSLETTGEF